MRPAHYKPKATPDYWQRKSSIREMLKMQTYQEYWRYCPPIGKYYFGIMNKKPPAGRDSMLFPVLITERKEEFDKLHAALTQELAPRGIVEETFVADIAHLVWGLLRSKTAILGMASKDAVRRILCGFTAVERDWAEKASAVWLTHAGVREDIIELIEASGLDESAIEAETMRIVAPDLEMLEKMMASVEMRFRKALRAIPDYRETFATQARVASNRLIEATPVIELEKRRTKKAD